MGGIIDVKKKKVCLGELGRGWELSTGAVSSCKTRFCRGKGPQGSRVIAGSKSVNGPRRKQGSRSQ